MSINAKKPRVDHVAVAKKLITRLENIEKLELTLLDAIRVAKMYSNVNKGLLFTLTSKELKSEIHSFNEIKEGYENAINKQCKK